MAEESKNVPETKIDPETAWVRLKSLAPVIALTATAVIIYMRFEQRMASVEIIMQRDAASRSAERDAIVSSVNGLRDEMRKIFIDSVATRQAQQWIELARALNRDKYPLLVWPDLPR